MKNTKIAKMFGILSILCIVVVLLQGAVTMFFGYSVFLLDSELDSGTREVQLVLNLILRVIFGILSRLPMYFGLLAFYFSGAMGKSVWTKVLLGLLVLIFFVEAVVWLGFQMSITLRVFEITVFEEGTGRDIYQFWFIPLGVAFFKLAPFIAVCFSVAALIEKRVSTSIALAPALAAAVYMFFGYAVARSKIELPDHFALALFIGLTGIYISGAIGRTNWSKLLLASLVILFVWTYGFNFLAESARLLSVIGIGGDLVASSLLGWFKLLGVIKYVFLPILAITFGIGIFVFNKENAVAGIFSIVAGLLYVFSSIIPDSLNVFANQGAGELFGSILVNYVEVVIWSLIAFAVFGVSRLVKPFLIFVVFLSGIVSVFGVFKFEESTDLFALTFSAFLVGTILQLILSFYIWNAIDDDKTPIKPWIAVAGGIVPFIGTIWSMVILSKYPKAYDSFIDRNNLTASYISRTPFWMYITFFILSTLFFWVPYAGKFFGFIAFIASIFVIFVGCSAVSRLASNPGEIEIDAVDMTNKAAVLGI